MGTLPKEIQGALLAEPGQKPVYERGNGLIWFVEQSRCSFQGHVD